MDFLNTEDINDIELRELFNVLWYPSGVVEGEPMAPDMQSMPNGMYGNVFDILVDRPARARAIFDYPMVMVAGDADLASIQPVISEYVRDGGTLIVNVAAIEGSTPAMGLIQGMLGVKFTGNKTVSDNWGAFELSPQAATPFEVNGTTVTTAEVIASGSDGSSVPIITRNKVGAGAVILTLIPHMIGLDQRAHPALPWLMNGLTEEL